MLITCSKNLILDDIITNFDISNVNTWNNNTGNTINSLTTWDHAIYDDIFLCDYGLTMFDIGKSINMNESKYLMYDNQFRLQPITYNTVSGETIITQTPSLTGQTDNIFGNYFELNGGYFNNYFKLQGYNYQVLPTRYGEGFTIETMLKIYPNSEGMFLFMGTRSEDKYNIHFSGETRSYTIDELEIIRTGVIGQIIEQTTTTTIYEGVKTSEDNFLYSLEEKNVRKGGFSDFDDVYNIEYVQVLQSENISNNALGFFITENKKIGYKTINSNGLMNTKISPNSLSLISTTSGWTTISIVFRPNEVIENFDESNSLCYNKRIGDLVVYANGRKFWEINDFDEFYFKPLKNSKEKLIGVPYNISWGGGSFGLKHSFHYDFDDLMLYDENDDIYIINNFIINSGTTLIEEYLVDNDVIAMSFNHVSGNTLNEYIIQYSTPIEILPNRPYIISGNIFNQQNAFQYMSNYEITMHVSGETGVTIIDGYSKTNNNVFDNKNEIYLKFISDDVCEKQLVNIMVLIKSSVVLNNNFSIKIANLKLNGSTKYVQDELKKDLLIESNFNSSFIGGIQKLRIYNKQLSSRDILNNTMYDLKINNINGGRLIYV